MAEHHLATYLNDHLSGSELALELLEHLERTYAGTALARFAVELRVEIEADRRELEGLMARLQVAQSRPRKAAAWFSEKFAELKLRLDDPSAGALRLLEIFEALITRHRGQAPALALTGDGGRGIPRARADRLSSPGRARRGRTAGRWSCSDWKPRRRPSPRRRPTDD